MAAVQNYQCPACGGPLAFDAGSATLHCSYCDSSFDPNEIAAQYASQQTSATESNVQEADSGTFDAQESSWNTSELNNDWGQEASAMKEYSCPSCGASIICEQTTAATSCPYCDNPTIVQTQFAGSLRPDYIIPFKLQKEKAIDALREFYKEKPLLPAAFAEQNHLEEIKGIYVPFWFFDGTASGSAAFHATNSQLQRRSEETVRITRTYLCQRAGEVDFKLVPVDASKRMDDDMMDSLEPYDYGDLRPFSTGFLPGYLADIHDVSAEDCFERANVRCAATFVQALRGTVQGYETCQLKSKRITLKQGVVHYGLLPVYLLNTRFEEKKYTFAVNGQSGKVVGDLPVSGSRAAGRFFKNLFASLFVGLGIGFGIVLLTGMVVTEDMLMPFGMIVLFVGLIVASGFLSRDKAKMKTVATAVEARRYADGAVRLSLKQDAFQYEASTVIASNRSGGSGPSMGGGFSGPGASFGNMPGGFTRPGGGFSGGGFNGPGGGMGHHGGASFPRHPH